MGYVLSAYVVDAVQLRSALGSGDRRLLDRIVRSNPDEFGDDDEFAANGSRLGLRLALETLINQGLDAVDEDPQYRYAFEELLRFVGVWTLGDRYDPDQIQLDRLRARSLPLRIPNPGDLPVFACLTFDCIDVELEQAATSAAAADGDSELLDRWVKTLKMAKKRGADVWVVRG